jgi:hypothetical protein
LGWRVRPNLHDANFLGTGIEMRTNARGLREDHDVAPSAAPDRLRVLCVGDSFTFGNGVSNRDTWCAQLASQDRRFEGVNMGTPGYGADQAYLRYLRDDALDTGVHVFAFIDEDFDRMTSGFFLDTLKPTLGLRQGSLVPEHVPVPTYWNGPVSHAVFVGAAMAKHLALFRAAAWLVERVRPFPTDAVEHQRLTPVIRAMVTDLRDRTAARGTSLVLVRLPTSVDPPFAQSWQPIVQRAAADAGVPYVDLGEEFNRQPIGDAASFIIRADDPTGMIGAGHYTPLGHSRIAAWLIARLTALDAVQQRLARLTR